MQQTLNQLLGHYLSNSDMYVRQMLPEFFMQRGEEEQLCA
jgi:hypothetical protein